MTLDDQLETSFKDSKGNLFQIKSLEVDLLKFLTQLHASVPAIFIPIVSSVGHKITDQLLIGWSIEALLVVFGFILIKSKIALLTLKEMTEVAKAHNNTMLRIAKLEGKIDPTEFEKLQGYNLYVCHDLKWKENSKEEFVSYFLKKKVELQFLLPTEFMEQNNAKIAMAFYTNHTFWEFFFLIVSITPLLLYLWHAWLISIIVYPN